MCKCRKPCARCRVYSQIPQLTCGYLHACDNTKTKVNQVQFFGGDNVEIKLEGDTFDDCLKSALSYTEQHDMTFIDPFNNVHTIAGQGTLAKK